MTLEDALYSFTLGDLRCSMVLDSTLRVRPELVFTTERAQSWPLLDLDRDGRLPTPVFVLLVEGSRRSLVDAGSGARPDLMADGQGRAADRLAFLGVQPSDIDAVVLTHAHLDHVGGIVTSRSGPNKLTYRNARHYLARAAWQGLDTAVASGVATASDEAAHRALSFVRDAGALVLVEADSPVDDAIRMLSAPGHTPGNCAAEVRSGDHRLVFVGDTFHHARQFEDPELVSPVDHDRLQVPPTRRSIIEHIRRTGALVAGAHFSYPGIGSLEGTPENARFKAVAGGAAPTGSLDAGVAKGVLEERGQLGA